MLEPLVSSRIRRTLLEYLLAHPTDRFYLRGLSKELGLSVSPLRRELKRLERSGMIAATPEGNILFYTVNTISAAFLQLNSLKAGSSKPKAVALNPEPSALSQPVTQVAVVRRRVFSAPAFAGVMLALLVSAMAYLVGTNQRLSSQMSRLLTIGKPHVTVVVPPASTSGAMRGARWRVVPGGFGGGFSTDASSESY